jgi:hypothetical protein
MAALLKSKLKSRPSGNIPTVASEEPGIAYTPTYGYHLASLTLQLTPAGLVAFCSVLRRHEPSFDTKGFAGSA